MVKNNCLQRYSQLKITTWHSAKSDLLQDFACYWNCHGSSAMIANTAFPSLSRYVKRSNNESKWAISHLGEDVILLVQSLYNVYLLRTYKLPSCYDQLKAWENAYLRTYLVSTDLLIPTYVCSTWITTYSGLILSECLLIIACREKTADWSVEPGARRDVSLLMRFHCLLKLKLAARNCPNSGLYYHVCVSMQFI